MDHISAVASSFLERLNKNIFYTISQVVEILDYMQKIHTIMTEILSSFQKCILLIFHDASKYNKIKNNPAYFIIVVFDSCTELGPIWNSLAFAAFVECITYHKAENVS